MSEFAFIRFLSLSLLTEEEKENKKEIIECTEKVLDAEGIECDSKISKVSEEKLKEILEEVRKIRKKKRKNYDEYENTITVEEAKE
ncbi:MAG TPA: hypothetical protein VFG45_09270 [Candidatus Nitrosocosmicus sp.]|jgi:hypothetical protein|nr:hypothetical protein [Candidatus Nitrosocosmicus sp.]HET6590341.1 hypothetical protein [Candidatus Nitrosocosmicus sp.]